MLPVGLLPAETRETDGASRDLERHLRAGTGAGSGNHARHFVRFRPAVLHTASDTGVDVSVSLLLPADLHDPADRARRPAAEVQTAASSEVPVDPSAKRSLLLPARLVPAIFLLDDLHRRRRRQPLRSLCVPDLLDAAGHVRQADETASRRCLLRYPEDLRGDASSPAAVRSYAGGYLGTHRHTDVSH